MGVLLFVLAWTALSLPIGILVGKAIAELDCQPRRARLARPHPAARYRVG
jgi:hypothetical protein